MLTRLLTACSIAIAVQLFAVAQQRVIPPNGPAIPVVRLTGGGTDPGRPTPVKPADQPTTWNMEIVGHEDLQGRSAYQPLIINQNGRHIAYVGHHDNQKPIVNPMTGQPEINGTSVVDVTAPERPKYLAHIASGRGGAQMVRVCSGDILPKGVKGKWYLLRPYGNSAQEIYDVTDPAKPSKLVTIQVPVAVRLPIVLTMDVSLSMGATDVQPSRLASAKDTAKQFIDELPDRFEAGLVTFAREADVVVPPTQDNERIKTAIDALVLDQYTATGEGIYASLDVIEQATDGVQRRTDDERLAFLVTQLRAARRVGASGIRLPIAQAGTPLLRRLLPILHDLDLVLYEEIQGQQTPDSPATASAIEAIAALADPRGYGELKGLLASAGFTDIRAFGGLDGSPYDQTAGRLVVTASRP